MFTRSGEPYQSKQKRYKHRLSPRPYKKKIRKKKFFFEKFFFLRGLPLYMVGHCRIVALNFVSKKAKKSTPFFGIFKAHHISHKVFFWSKLFRGRTNSQDWPKKKAKKFWHFFGKTFFLPSKRLERKLRTAPAPGPPGEENNGNSR